MKHLLALPALLRASILLAAASPHTFSVHDDLLAFPQFEVKFTEDYLSELQAQSRLRSNGDPNTQTDRDALQDPPPAQVEQYRPQDAHAGGKKKEEPKLEHEYMVLDNQRYLCSIPQVKAPSSSSSASGPGNDTLSKAEEEKELARATDRGWELLSGMQGHCVYFISGWWSYRFCYGQGVKQFHQLPPGRGVPNHPPVEDPSVHGFELGNYEEDGKQGLGQAKGQAKGLVGSESDDEVPSETGAAEKMEEYEGDAALDLSEGFRAKHRRSEYGELVQRGESRFLVQRLGKGTTCDLTGKERKIEVQVRSHHTLPYHYLPTSILTRGSSTATPNPPTASPSSKKPAPAPTSWSSRPRVSATTSPSSHPKRTNRTP